RLNEELNKTQKLESVGVLAGGIAHDFNNILTAIMGNLNLAQHLINPKDKIYPLLEAADKASRRAKTLTHQLLTFAKGGNPVKKTANLGRIIRETANFALHGSSVQCLYDIPNDLWLVDLDPGQMSQVIQNLIINARQAMSSGGRIMIKSTNISSPEKEMYPVLDPDGKYIKTTITDEGPGIPAAIIEQIFDPYFTTKEKGSGLGLAISHSIISKHGGFIKTASHNKGGTVFTIYLPVTTGEPGNQTSSITPQSAIKPASGELIMIMDDEKMIRNIAKMMLETNGFEVITVKDGEEALKVYKQYQKALKTVSATIMDLTIPGGMGGKEAVTKILALDPRARVIASSGYSNDPVMTDFHSYGFCAAITKPYLINDLLSTVSQALS
ncbi:MAG TPA: response regulator, partial [Desulfobacterales bacterium]|nr:response regulator [Desulfobacterales bacterium]